MGPGPSLSLPATLCLDPADVACVQAETAGQLSQLGIPGWYLQLAVALHDIVVPLGHLIVAVIIFWRARDNWLGLATSALLAIFALWVNTNVLDALAAYLGGGPAWQALFLLLNLVMFVSVAFLLFAFPAGRFASPRIFALAAAAALLMSAGGIGLLPAGTDALALILALAGGLGYQVYLYRRVATAVQRQQAKWVLVGLSSLVANAVVWYVVVVPAAQRGAELLALAIFAPFNAILSLLLPVAIGISILRYRLWDIDLIIRRTLVYSILTAALAAVYLGSVLVLQSLLRLLTGQTQSQLVTVLSTLAIAALFVPARGAVQRAIDRRFYRRKYDAGRTLSEFSAAARDEVDLARLADDLVQVIDQTMQPAYISLWLKTHDPRP